MSLIKKRNGSLYPSLTNDIFENSLFGLNGIFDSDNPFWNRSSLVPLANISETKNEFNVDLSAPGLTRGDFKVEVDDGILTVSCEKQEESKEDKENYKRREFSYNSFTRSFQLPENVAEDKINAKYDNGMLHISLPKKEMTISKAKKSIQVG
jgi:HSP20 family protein